MQSTPLALFAQAVCTVCTVQPVFTVWQNSPLAVAPSPAHASRREEPERGVLCSPRRPRPIEYDHGPTDLHHDFTVPFHVCGDTRYTG